MLGSVRERVCQGRTSVCVLSDLLDDLSDFSRGFLFLRLGLAVVFVPTMAEGMCGWGVRGCVGLCQGGECDPTPLEYPLITTLMESRHSRPQFTSVGAWSTVMHIQCASCSASGRCSK